MYIYIIVQNTSKLTTTACFIQGESSGGRQISKKSELFLCSRRKRGSVVIKIACTLPRFLLGHKNRSDFFEICLPPKDSPWMKQAVMVSFEVFCTIIRFALSICH